MTTEMDKKIPAFNKVMRTRCFLHILNLVAKSMLKQFELPKKNYEDFTEEEQEVLGDLMELGKDLDTEEAVMRQAEEEDVDVDVDDEELDWVEEVQLTEEDSLQLRKQVKPITCMLIKVYGILTFIMPSSDAFSGAKTSIQDCKLDNQAATGVEEGARRT